MKCTNLSHSLHSVTPNVIIFHIFLSHHFFYILILTLTMCFHYYDISTIFSSNNLYTQGNNRTLFFLLTFYCVLDITSINYVLSLIYWRETHYWPIREWFIKLEVIAPIWTPNTLPLLIAHLWQYFSHPLNSISQHLARQATTFLNFTFPTNGSPYLNKIFFFPFQSITVVRQSLR